MRISLQTDFDVGFLVDRLVHVGAVSVKIVGPGLLKCLCEEAERDYTFVKRREDPGSAGVTQDLWGVDEPLRVNGLLDQVRNQWQLVLGDKFAQLHKYPFGVSLRFNDTSLQKYDAGSRGISVPVDPKNLVNLICIVCLKGICRFCICDDRNGSNPVQLDATPGSVIMMKAPGFLLNKEGTTDRPYHFITDIQGPRISFGLRQTLTPTEEAQSPWHELR